MDAAPRRPATPGSSWVRSCNAMSGSATADAATARRAAAPRPDDRHAMSGLTGSRRRAIRPGCSGRVSSTARARRASEASKMRPRSTALVLSLLAAPAFGAPLDRLIVGADAGGAPQVIVHDGDTPVLSFFA